jgi:hypothetical protein
MGFVVIPGLLRHATPLLNVMLLQPLTFEYGAEVNEGDYQEKG